MKNIIWLLILGLAVVGLVQGIGGEHGAATGFSNHVDSLLDGGSVVPGQH